MFEDKILLGSYLIRLFKLVEKWGELNEGNGREDGGREK